MIGANTHQGCIDFDRDAEIWVVGFRERLDGLCRERRANSSFWRALVGVSVSSGLSPLDRNFVWFRAGDSLKSSSGCTDFSQDAEILVAGFRERLRFWKP